MGEEWPSMSDPLDHGESKNSMLSLSFQISPEWLRKGKKKGGGVASALERVRMPHTECADHFALRVTSPRA